MLADPKSDAFITNFAGQWLYLRELATVQTDAKSFDENLRHAFRRETEMLFGSIVRENRSLLDLIDADYTFVDERLARHYGIPDVNGSYFRRVSIDPASPRRGLLGHGSMLTVTSVATRTSPVSRGKWVLENLLGTPAPIPPPGVETNLDETGKVAKPTSLRQRLERYMDGAGEFRFRLKAANGETIAVSEAYNAKASAENGVESVRTNAPDAELVDLT